MALSTALDSSVTRTGEDVSFSRGNNSTSSVADASGLQALCNGPAWRERPLLLGVENSSTSIPRSEGFLPHDPNGLP